MEEIVHRTVEVNGIKMHIAEKGEGPVVLLLHGFPELWYSWRHQILGLAEKGYRAIAPDLRGYGDTDAPASVSSYSIFHLVGDIVALIDALAQDQVYVVGHDWGAFVSWYLCLFRPEKVKALVNLSVPFLPRNPTMNLTDFVRSLHGDDFYVIRFQEPGDVEEEFARLGTNLVLKKLFAIHDPAPLLIPKGWGSPDDQIELPSWLSEEDIDYYASKYKKNGFAGPINYYRNFGLNWELTAPWTEAQINVPTKFIVGDQDMVYHYFPGIQDYIHKGGFKKLVPLLEEVVVMPGVAHWINQEKAHEVTEYIYDFIKKF